jgi:hypothetical protein
VPKKPDTPAVVQALDAVSFAADELSQDVQDLGRTLSKEQRVNMIVFAADVRRRLDEVRGGLPPFVPPEVPRRVRPSRHPFGATIHRDREE